MKSNYNEYDHGLDEYDQYFYLHHERVENEKELEMNALGYDFITNFTLEREGYYRKAAEMNKIDIMIKSEVYTGFGTLMNDPSYRALYVSSEVNDLSAFWNTVDELKSA